MYHRRYVRYQTYTAKCEVGLIASDDLKRLRLVPSHSGCVRISLHLLAVSVEFEQAEWQYIQFYFLFKQRVNTMVASG